VVVECSIARGFDLALRETIGSCLVFVWLAVAEMAAVVAVVAIEDLMRPKRTAIAWDCT
jgi:hypothetical protein